LGSKGSGTTHSFLPKSPSGGPNVRERHGGKSALLRKIQQKPIMSDCVLFIGAGKSAKPPSKPFL
jgi:hypothetical protein